MSDTERRLMIAKCGELLYRVLTDIRNLTWVWEPGNEKWIEELSDLTHNLPRFMTGRDDYAVVGLREAFAGHARRRWPDVDPARTGYVALLDMTEAEFAVHYGPKQHPWPEPVPATAG